jgi:hypothetical protein
MMLELLEKFEDEMINIEGTEHGILTPTEYAEFITMKSQFESEEFTASVSMFGKILEWLSLDELL